MSRVFSAREVAVLAMRNVGSVAVQDSAAPEGKVLIALQFLDLLLAEKTGTQLLASMIPLESTFTYTADADSVDITSLLGSGARINFFKNAYVAETDDPIGLMTRREFEYNRNTGLFPFPTARGLYISEDGDDTFTAFLRPIPTVALEIRVMGTTLAPTVSNATKDNSTENAHQFGSAYQRWMVNALSADIGDGPLARLPIERLDRYEAKAAQSWAKLVSTRGGGQRGPARFTRPYNG